MRPPKLGTLLAIAACLILALPAIAQAIPIHRHLTKTIRKEKELPVATIHYVQVVHVAPTDTDEDGIKDSADGCPETAGPDNGCPAPAPAVDSPVVVAEPAPVASVPAAPATTGACPSYMAAEASSPSAVNPSSGAAGCYQILPSTAAANGCSDVGPSCAAAICASQGPSAWASSGANPCPYVEP